MKDPDTMPVKQIRANLHFIPFLLTFVLPSLLLAGCAVAALPARFAVDSVPAPPDYSQDRYWAALPWREDAADETPDGLHDRQQEAPADVFFIHPTTYSRKSDEGWNAPVDDAEVNARTDEGPIRYQASIFNGVGRVFAPYYRQANLRAYYSEDTTTARRAFSLAYTDVRDAFQYYLDHYNEGRPIIIAAHSQGTTHGRRLVREFFDGTPRQKQLVAAYLVGIPVYEADYRSLQPCRDSLQTGCLISWRTWKRGHGPEQVENGVIVTNPLTWTTDETYAPGSLNQGAVLRDFSRVQPGMTDAQIEGPVLWAEKPDFLGSALLGKNYHIGDYNLYYMNVRNNAAARLRVYLEN